MERWRDKVAVVTGASSGIGLATAKSFVYHGLTVIGLDCNGDKMKDEMMNVNGSGEFFAKECDITDEKRVIEIFNWIKIIFKSCDILVNNAGVMTFNIIVDSSTADLEAVFKVNVFGLLYCAKQAIKLMKENQIEGHIINMNSVVGHQVQSTVAELSNNVYSASKFAITALSETLRNELSDSKIRVTSISPGPVETEMFKGAMKIIPRMKSIPVLKPESVSNAIIYALSVPADVEINEITLRPKSL